MIYVRLKVLFLIFTFSVTSFAKGSDPDISKIKIPFRVDALAVAVSANSTFNAYKEDYSIDGYGVGANFEVPLPGIHSMIGLTGFLSFDMGEDDNLDSVGFVGAYTGVSFSIFDLVLGPCWGYVGKQLKNDYASPDDEIIYRANTSGGFIGIRKGLFTGEAAGIAFGIKGFYMSSDEYKKEVKEASSSTKTTEDFDTSVYGAIFELHFSIGKQVKHSSWLPWLW